jgi:hypothetical protein
MSDALPANWSGKAETIAAKCWAHARRPFVELEALFPEECGQVLEAIAKLYQHEAETAGMSGSERLQYHQSHSGPVLSQLQAWICAQFAQCLVEPNSSLGKALRYLQTHWEALTQFLNCEGVPLDNNAAERALKRAVLLRKNALFYKNEHGAGVGDILLSLLETCRLNRINAWDYLLTVLKSRSEARLKPAAFLPWNYPRTEVQPRAA